MLEIREYNYTRTLARFNRKNKDHVRLGRCYCRQEGSQPMPEITARTAEQRSIMKRLTLLTGLLVLLPTSAIGLS